MCTLAQKKSSGCLSDKYFNNSTKLKWCQNILDCYLRYAEKTLEYHQGLELDIPYYDYGFAIEVQEE
ncbi:hypothetical protein RclHR1_01910029 [Rhizophagus clarus]|nr:hypothetical protein RclHR1_01910029 [Rhizophagus clarus]